jgi:hypothetical protein
VNILDRLRTSLDQGMGRAPAETTLPANAPRDAVNDALSYGVSVVAARPAPGAWYWQAVRVHHLSPEENHGNHHLFVDLNDPSAKAPDGDPLGRRIDGARARVTWEGGEQVIVVDKPAGEPGTNLPMWKWQVCAVEALGAANQELPSDRVVGLHTAHPDEGEGNTLFHHSFLVSFIKVRAPENELFDSVISGTIRNAEGRTAVLLEGTGKVATVPLDATGMFRFADLGPGEYTIAVEGTPFRSEPVRMDGRNRVQLDLNLVVADSIIGGAVRNGNGRTVVLMLSGKRLTQETLGAKEAYRFAGLKAGSYQVMIPGTRTASAAIAVDGRSSARADLVAPTAGRVLEHYVLFGPADEPSTQANLLLAQDFLLTFEPAFGFNPAEAARAGMVTIVGDDGAVAPQIEADLGADGTPVQRIAGTVEAVAAALEERIARGQPFS